VEQLGGAAASLTRIVLIVLVAWLLVVVLQRVVGTLRERIASRLDDREAPSAPRPWIGCSAT
jgi:hypothetical protein